MAKGRLGRAVVLVLALVALATAVTLFRATEAPVGGGDSPVAALTATPSGIEAGVLRGKVDQAGEFASRARLSKAHSPVLLLVVLVASGAVATSWRRRHSSLAAPLVVVHPLCGIGRRAPPHLRLTAH